PQIWATATKKKTRPQFGPVWSYGHFWSYRLDLETLHTPHLLVIPMGTVLYHGASKITVVSLPQVIYCSFPPLMLPLQPSL
ncbi:hypothetical protein L208DRAFT_1295473, partial [Tricholoma matsutake]